MRAAAYLRVSTEAQAGDDRFGLADQRASIEAFAKREGHTIAEWYSDEGISGATLDRPALAAMIAAAPTFNIVIVAKMDRIARDLMAQLWIEKELMKESVEIVSASEPFRGQDPSNVLFRQIIGAFAQFEKARITERMSGGRKQKARRGGYAGGGVVYGYTARRGAKALALDAEKAAAVRRVFALKADNPKWSARAIARALNDEGHTTAKGRRFTHKQVMRILSHKAIYMGRSRYAGIEADGSHPVILAQGPRP